MLQQHDAARAVGRRLHAQRQPRPDGHVPVSGGDAEEVGGARLTADESGAFAGRLGLPDIEFDRLPLRIAVSDRARIAAGAPPEERSASTEVTVAFFGAYFPPWNTDAPALARPGRRSRLEASGYIGSASRILYVHYVRRGALVKTLRVGRLRGACATLTTQFRQFDFRPVRPGTYRVYFDTARRWPNDDMFSGYRRVIVRR